MKINIHIFLFYISVNQLFAQSFSGKLTFKSEINDSAWFIQSLRTLSIPSKTFSFGFTDNIWIKNDSLKFLSITNKGKFNRSEYQNKDTAYQIVSINNKVRRLTFKEIQAMSPEGKFTLKEKGKNSRTILGYDCKEYIYYSEVGNSIFIHKVWIPDEFKSHEFYNKGKFFKFHFHPDGIAFRVEAYNEKEVLVTSRELIDIKKFDVPNSEFEECGESDIKD